MSASSIAVFAASGLLVRSWEACAVALLPQRTGAGTAGREDGAGDDDPVVAGAEHVEDAPNPANRRVGEGSAVRAGGVYRQPPRVLSRAWPQWCGLDTADPR